MKRYIHLSIVALSLATTGGTLHSAAMPVDTLIHREPLVQSVQWSGSNPENITLKIKNEPIKAVRKRIADFLSIAPEKIILRVHGRDQGDSDETLSAMFHSFNTADTIYLSIEGTNITTEQLYAIFGGDSPAYNKEALATIQHRRALIAAEKAKHRTLAIASLPAAPAGVFDKASCEKQIALLQNEMASLGTQLRASIEKNTSLEKELAATKAQLSSVQSKLKESEDLVNQLMSGR